MATRKRDAKDIKLHASHERLDRKERKGPAAAARARKRPPPKKRLLPAPVSQRVPAQSATRKTAPASQNLPAERTKTRAPTESTASESARKLAIEIAAAGLEKKALGLEILDVAGRVDYADFLVLMSGRSDRQVAALAEGIEEALGRHGRRAINVEGRANARWILLDFADVVVHVFQEEARSEYDIEGLWQDARRVPMRNE